MKRRANYEHFVPFYISCVWKYDTHFSVEVCLEGTHAPYFKGKWNISKVCQICSALYWLPSCLEDRILAFYPGLWERDSGCLHNEIGLAGLTDAVNYGGACCRDICCWERPDERHQVGHGRGTGEAQLFKRQVGNRVMTAAGIGGWCGAVQ